MKKVVLATALLCWGAQPLAAPAPVVEGANQSAPIPLSMADRVERLERQMRARGQAQLQLQQVLDQMQREIGQLRGQVEEQTYQIEQVVNRQRQLFKELSKLQSRPTTKAEPKTSTPALPVGSLSETDAYQQAFSLATRERRFDDAIPAFEAFIKNYPQSRFVPNGYYWLGQMHYVKESWSEAATMFAKVADNYPDSNKRADSVLKLGLIAKRQGDAAMANKHFQQVVDEYAGTSVAKMAQKELR